MQSRRIGKTAFVQVIDIIDGLSKVSYIHAITSLVMIHVVFIISRHPLTQINYSFSCLQCPTIYAQMDEKTGDAKEITKAIPLPALNVREQDTKQCLINVHGWND